MIIEFLAAALVIALLFDFIGKKRRNDILSDMPGPRSLPIVGAALMYVNKKPEDIMDFVFKNRIKYGKLFRVWIFNQLAIFSCDPKDVEVILSNPKYIRKNNLYKMLQVWLGNGLLLSTGQKWHSRRKIITPAFHFNILEQFVQVFDQQSSILVRKLNKFADGRTSFNIQPLICLATLDIITETAMGTKINAQSDISCDYVRAVNEVTDIMSNRFVKVWHRSDLVFSLTAPLTKRRQQRSIKVMHDFTERIIKDRRKCITIDDNNEVHDEIGTKKRLALLDILLRSSIEKQPLSDQDIREEVDTFMFEGHDTTNSGISFALHLISRHPEVQQKMLNEIHEVMGEESDMPMTMRILQELKYLEWVIKESLRLYPPVPFIGRYFTDDVNLNGKLIPAGTNYTVGIYAMLRDKDTFPEPHEFRPERHAGDLPLKANPYAYIPFSAGPRNCIGQKFAMLEMKCIIAKIVKNYELLPIGPEIRPVVKLVLKSASGFHLGLRKR